MWHDFKGKSHIEETLALPLGMVPSPWLRETLEVPSWLSAHQSHRHCGYRRKGLSCQRHHKKIATC